MESEGGTHDRILPRRLHRRRLHLFHRPVHRDWRFGMSEYEKLIWLLAIIACPFVVLLMPDMEEGEDE